MARSSSATCRAARSSRSRPMSWPSSSATSPAANPVRIVGGKHRGRQLAAPPGWAVRPTGGRARGALFDILAHGRFGARPIYEDARVLDAFAGTGAFGLEALSRGARFASFIEKDRVARAVLQQNITTLGETTHAAILNADATRPP